MVVHTGGVHLCHALVTRTGGVNQWMHWWGALVGCAGGVGC